MRSTYVRWLSLCLALPVSMINLGCGDGGPPASGSKAAQGEAAQPMPAGMKTSMPMQVFGGVDLPAVNGGIAGIPKSAEQETVPSTNSEAYDHVAESVFLATKDRPLSTFSIDVDTASYSNARRFLQQRQLPPADAVRIEEFLNYFTYNYPQPEGDRPFSVHMEVAGCPWNPDHRLAKIGIQGRKISENQRPGTNLVFLLDVSGSMNHAKKLPLLQESMRMLVERLGETDHVAIVVYAGAAGVVLPSTSATRKEVIVNAINRLTAGGSTNGALGIRVAYDIATENFIKNGVNRVVLCTDGDFNVGITNPLQLDQLIEAKAKSGVFLTVLGFGMNNLKDATMERLADKGNGNYAYIDSPSEAKKVLVDQLSGTLVTIAKDVKIQSEFNPAQIAGYRLIGYDNRRMADRDFQDDAKDAGEIGAGHSVTALYELVPAGKDLTLANASQTPLKYQSEAAVTTAIQQASIPENGVVTDPKNNELLTLRLRYKQPAGDTSQLLEFVATESGKPFAQATEDFRFASAVASFGLLLKNSRFRGQASFDLVLDLAESSGSVDPNGYRKEFVNLVRIARQLQQAHEARPNVSGD